MTSARWAGRSAEYERRSTVPMTVLVLLFLAVYATAVVWRDRPPTASAVLETASMAIWAAFAVDLVVRVAPAEHRFRRTAGHCWCRSPTAGGPWSTRRSAPDRPSSSGCRATSPPTRVQRLDGDLRALLASVERHAAEG